MKKTVLAILILLVWGVKGFAQNEKDASADTVSVWKLMSSQNDLRASAKLGIHYLYNGNIEESYKCFQKVESAYNLGAYESNPNLSERNKRFLKDSTILCQNALYDLCVIYLHEESPQAFRNAAKGMALIRKLASKNHTRSQVWLGIVYRYGENGVSPNPAEAFKWFKKAAEAGDYEAQYYVAYMYYHGEGVAQNDAEAFKWFKKAATESEVLEAQYYVGLMYFNGEGVTQDVDKAKYWADKTIAEDPDYVECQSLLGLIYGVKHNYEESFKWHKKAADAGDAVSQSALGMMYYYGLGVAKSVEKARYWINKSAAQNNEMAKKMKKEFGL